MEKETNEFYEGDHVKVIYWPDGSMVRVGQNGVEKITVVMECGQMAGVPWFAVWKDGKIVYKHNGAMLESVEL